MAMITCDHIKGNRSITYDTNLNFQREIGKAKHNQATVELIQNIF